MPRVRVNAVIDMLDSEVIATCLPFMLEAGYSAQSAMS
jgi:hypothetical protein